MKNLKIEIMMNLSEKALKSAKVKDLIQQVKSGHTQNDIADDLKGLAQDVTVKMNLK